MKALKKITTLLVIIAMIFSSAAFAATPEEIAAATYDGMVWLAGVQNGDGSWGTDYPDKLGRTGLALLKFETHALNSPDPEIENAFDPDYEFSTNASVGMDYLLSQVTTVGIVAQPAGDPDTDGDGLGVTLVYGDHHNTYITGIALMAVVASGTPDRVVNFGPLTGWTYGDVAQDMVDYLAFGQTDFSPGRGGWDYYANRLSNTRSDNSISGYATMGLAFAEHPVYGFGCVIPQFVKDELSIWIDYIQNDASGGSGYDTPTTWVDLLKTGNLLQQMAFVGDSVATARVQNAIGYIQTNWNAAIGGSLPYVGWRGDPSNYQATFTLMKGLQAFDKETLNIGGDPNYNWFDDIAEELLAEQIATDPPGPIDAWPDSLWDDEDNHILSTTWALLTLQKVAPPPPIRPIDINIKPGSFPNAVKPKPVGVLPVAILGSEDFDVGLVDCETVSLMVEGEVLEIAPLRCNYEDVQSDPPELAPDGYMDIIMHFDMEQVLELIGLDAEGEIELMIIGEDMDGYAFQGTDVIWIVPKAK